MPRYPLQEADRRALASSLGHPVSLSEHEGEVEGCRGVSSSVSLGVELACLRLVLGCPVSRCFWVSGGGRQAPKGMRVLLLYGGMGTFWLCFCLFGCYHAHIMVTFLKSPRSPLPLILPPPRAPFPPLPSPFEGSHHYHHKFCSEAESRLRAPSPPFRPRGRSHALFAV